MRSVFRILGTRFRWINFRTGCLLLVILAALLFIFCGMAARMTYTI
jgi:hypothetical protein